MYLVCLSVISLSFFCTICTTIVCTSPLYRYRYCVEIQTLFFIISQCRVPEPWVGTASRSSIMLPRSPSEFLETAGKLGGLGCGIYTSKSGAL